MDATVENNFSTLRYMTEFLKRGFELFERRKRELKFLDSQKNLILLLGPTGTGKSAFAQLVFTNAENVKSVETAGDDFIMDDGDVNIGRSLIKSKTITPIFFADTWDSRIAITACDCGGFGDTRDMSHDLAVNLLIKTVVDFADSVKMIFFINHSSVRSQVDKASFMNLLRHITDLVKNINKFRNGIALIVTKVDNKMKKKGEQYVLVDDESVISGIAQFLAQTKQELKENQKSGVGENKNYIENAINIIDILLTQNAGIFTRIKLFRRPEECGPLSASTLCRDARRSFSEIFHSTSYVEKDNDDFGYCLSGDSINVVNAIIEEINQIISTKLMIIADIVQKYFERIQKNIFETTTSIMAGAADARDHQTKAKELASEFRNAVCVIEKLIDEVKIKNEKVVRIVQEHISHLKVEIPEDIITDLINEVKYLDFLKTTCKKEFSMRSYDGIFNNILLFVEALAKHLQKHIGECVRKTEVHLKSALEGLTTAIEKEYTKQMGTLDPESVLRMLENEKLIFSTMLEKIPVVQGTKKLIETFCNIENDLSIRFPADIRNRISFLKVQFLCFENLSNKDCSIDLSSHCMLTLQAVAKFIQKSQSWYKWIKDLHGNGSQYKIQKVKHMYNVKNLKDWGNSKAEKGIYITQENFELFLEKVSSISLAECSSVKNLQLSVPRQEELNNILDLIFKHEMKISMTETSVTVQGDYISFKSLFSSDHNPHLNNGKDSLLTILSRSKIKTVRFFAFHTIFIDHDIDFVGKKISLAFIAPKWEVIGTRKIDLSGKVGDEPPIGFPMTSADHKKANDGAPGKPGGPGGSFYGIGETFINGENLTIFTRGGKGGAGQRGQDGRNGEDAVITCLKDVFNRCSSLPTWIENTLDIFGKLSKRRVAVPFESRAALEKEEENAFQKNQIVLKVNKKEESGMDEEEHGRNWENNLIWEPSGHEETNLVINSHSGHKGEEAGGTDGQSGKKKALNVSSKLSKAWTYARSVYPFGPGEVTENVEEKPFQSNKIVLEVSKEGESGGDGGKGGHGGNPGEISIYIPRGSVTFEFVNNHGESGCDGAGGTGGQSGKKKVLRGSEREGIIVELEEGDLPGEDGSDGSNFNNLEDPEPAPIFNNFSAVSEFKNISTYPMTDRFREFHLRKIMKYI